MSRSEQMVDPTVRQELHELGEPEPDPTELVQQERDAAIGWVAAVVELGEDSVEGPPLSELERHRVWRRVVAARAGDTEHEASSLPSRRVWASVMAAVGVAAAWVLAPRPAPRPEARVIERAVGVRELGREARRGLAVLGADEPGSRARELAVAHARRLTDEGAGR